MLIATISILVIAAVAGVLVWFGKNAPTQDEYNSDLISLAQNVHAEKEKMLYQPVIFTNNFKPTTEQTEAG